MFGLSATIAGGFLGGLLVHRLGIMRSLLLAGVLQAVTNLLFVVQALVGHHLGMLTVTIGIDNLSIGMATSAFVAYLSSLCSVAYTGTQYALLSSLMSLARLLLSTSAGWLADRLGWPSFFLLAAAAGLPGMALLVLLLRRLPPRPPAQVVPGAV